MSKSIVPAAKYTPASPAQQRLSDLFIWMPELVIMGIFLFGAMVTSGLISLICLLLAALPAGWIIACRARIARRNAKVLADYDADLIEADTQALADTFRPDGDR
ncbi:MAG TPA: hypothetical protein VFV66_02985 [Nonomuraea sp.]|nr:hypothetical protein [Nonomuraea sp.]